jgi:hypothetical protein
MVIKSAKYLALAGAVSSGAIAASVGTAGAADAASNTSPIVTLRGAEGTQCETYFGYVNALFSDGSTLNEGFVQPCFTGSNHGILALKVVYKIQGNPHVSDVATGDSSQRLVSIRLGQTVTAICVNFLADGQSQYGTEMELNASGQVVSPCDF